MRKVIVRVAMWASAGLLVSLAWATYFGSADRALRIEPMVHWLAAWTQPTTALALHLDPSRSLSVAWVTVANAAAYTLAGLMAEAIRGAYRALRVSS